MQRTLIALLAALLAWSGLPATPTAAATSTAKVVIVVGPVGNSTAHYIADADKLAAEAGKYTANVVKLYTPAATWTAVKAAAQGASILIYLGHGNGWPSPYPPFQTVTKDGMGLDPVVGADRTRHVYYGEDYIRDGIRLAPNAVVLLYHLCYASGNTEPGLATGTLTDSRQRVDNYGAGFIGAGARAVIADGHPDTLVVDTVRQLFTTDRTIDQVFRAAANWHGHPIGPFPSQRTPGLRYELDSDTTAPSGFYRSVVGDLDLRTTAVTGTLPSPTSTDPADYVMPGAAEVTAPAGAPFFASAEAAADPAATAPSTLAAGTHLRVLSEGTPAADGTRILGATILATTTSGFVRATDVTPRDSTAIAAWTLDQSAALLSPNADGANDALVVTTRFSETAATAFTVKNATGTVVKSLTATGDIVRHTWNLQDAAGATIPDGAYTWTLKAAKDAWGNLGLTTTGTFTVDATAPVSTGSVAVTPGGTGGWSLGPVTLSVTARDALSGVASTVWRADGAAARTYAAGTAFATEGTHTLEYRSVDKAGIREVWRSLTVRIDTIAPVTELPLAGTAGAFDGWWRGPVSVTPATTDASSGVAARSVSVDGATPVALAAGATVTVKGDGHHTITVTARDAAGNKRTVTAAFDIDGTAPVVTVPDPGTSTPVVTPNGDTASEQVVLPYSTSEAGGLAVVITDAAGAIVRTLPAAAIAAGPGLVSWDGRTAAGTPVPDGRYTATLTVTDVVGNPSTPIAVAVDVYAALAALARTPGLFYPQDGDTLAPQAAASFTLVSPATVTLTVLDGSGSVVRTGLAAAALPAGPATWAWDGRRDDGTFAAPGTYRIVVGATNGTQAAAQSTTVIADAFRITTSTAGATRGKSITVTATTAEPLATTPRLVVRQPGLSSWSVVMTKVAVNRWSATITPKTTGTPGTLTLQVKAWDTAGGQNSGLLRVAIQ